MKPTILEKWEISPEELTEVVESAPSLRGFLLGYVGEFKLRKYLMASGKIQDIKRYDDHDRRKKNDLVISYAGAEISIEVKSLQTNTIKKIGQRFEGKVQVDASDRRTIKLPTGETLATTCLLAGEFDILAVNLFAFEEKWRFGFARNIDLPRSVYRKYTEEQRKYLLATAVRTSWPLEPPFTENPFELFDEIVEERGD